MSDFDRAVGIVIDLEGGDSITDDPNDPGGLTKWGISQRAYPRTDIRSLTYEDACAIYKTDYWDAVRGDELPWPVNLIVFDSAVNQGPGTAIRLLQRTLRLYEDGALGPVTLAAAQRAGKRTCAALIAQRQLNYTRASAFQRYGLGWFTRCNIIAMEAGRG